MHGAVRALSCTALLAPAPVRAHSCLHSRGLCKYRDAFSCTHTNQQLGSSGCHRRAGLQPSRGRERARQAGSRSRERRQTLPIPSPIGELGSLRAAAEPRGTAQAEGYGKHSRGCYVPCLPQAGLCTEVAPRAPQADGDAPWHNLHRARGSAHLAAPQGEGAHPPLVPTGQSKNREKKKKSWEFWHDHGKGRQQAA